MKLNSWLETGLDGDVLLTPYVPKGITGYDDDDDDDDGLCNPVRIYGRKINIWYLHHGSHPCWCSGMLSNYTVFLTLTDLFVNSVTRRSEVLTTALMKIKISWCMTLCWLENSDVSEMVHSPKQSAKIYHSAWCTIPENLNFPSIPTVQILLKFDTLHYTLLKYEYCAFYSTNFVFCWN